MRAKRRTPLSPARIVVCALALLVAGCGWHLRGQATFDNLPALTIKGGDTALRYPLMASLESNGVVVSDAAHVTLHVLSELWEQRTVAVDNLGRVAAVELTYTMSWQLERDGKPLMQPRTIRLISNVNQDPVNATAASDELALSQQSMRQDVIWQLQRQLQSISTHQDLSAPASMPASTPLAMPASAPVTVPASAPASIPASAPVAVPPEPSSHADKN